MKRNYFVGFCFVLRSHGGGKSGQEKGVEPLSDESKERSVEVRFLSGEGNCRR